MRTLSCIIFISLFFSGQTFSQESRFNLEKILKTHNEQEVREWALTLIEKYKGSATAHYLEALIERDANKAVEKYIQLFTKFPKSKYAGEALFRTAQYNFSRGLYVSSRKYFLNLVEKFPGSQYADDSMYFAAACLYASRNYASSQSELKNFLTQYPNSPFKDLAKEDLKEIKSKTNGRTFDIRPQINKSKGKFTLQMGAFTQINNALNLRNYFSKLGLPVEIREKTRERKKVYLVWLGSFETKDTAYNFGETLKREHGKPYRIIEKF